MFEPDQGFLKGTFFESTLEVKKSKFIAALAYIENREQAMLQLSSARERYPDARHHCWAYVIKNGTSASMSDDGEPSGTAGKPMLSVIQHKSISNIVVIISRYFGGIKLGAGGLVRAYSGATQSVINLVPMLEPVIQIELMIFCDFAQEQIFRHWLGQYQGELLSLDYSDTVQIKIKLPEINRAAFLSQLDAIAVSYKAL